MSMFKQPPGAASLALRLSATVMLALFLGYATTSPPDAGARQSTAAGDEAEPLRVVFLGDSITAGYGLDREQAYPALLQQRADEAGLRIEMVNAGVSGDTTAGGLRRLDWVLGRGADVLVIALGGNDGLRGLQPEQTQANLLATIEQAREKLPDVRIILAGMQMPANLGARYVEQFAAVFPAVAEQAEVDLLPFLLDGVGGVAELNQDDQIHPNAAGQEAIADLIWRTLRPLLQGDDGEPTPAAP